MPDTLESRLDALGAASSAPPMPTILRTAVAARRPRPQRWPLAAAAALALTLSLFWLIPSREHTAHAAAPQRDTIAALRNANVSDPVVPTVRTHTPRRTPVAGDLLRGNWAELVGE